jgi:hypothetical protein
MCRHGEIRFDDSKDCIVPRNLESLCVQRKAVEAPEDARIQHFTACVIVVRLTKTVFPELKMMTRG